MSEDLFGYVGTVKKLLESIGAEVGDRLRVVKNGTVYEGVLMPRERLYGDRPILVIKLDNGYNIGIRVDESTKVEVVERRRAKRVSAAPRKHAVKEALPRVVMLSTGGTIVSKVDYETGAVKPALSAEELLEWIPEIEDVAVISMSEISRIFSEDMTPSMWSFIAEKVYKCMKDGYDGVVVAHGTDTMGYTAAALAFAIRDKSVPVVLVGSQRSSDRPSTDSAFNLKAAFLTAAKAPFAESVVVMHGETGDTYALAHRGTKVRKMHTSRRDAFQSINDKPLAIVYPDRGVIRVINRILEPRDKNREPILVNRFDEKVALVKIYPGIDPEVIDFLVDKGYHGIVVEGTGLGHTPQKLIGSIERAVEEGIPVIMTSQCLFGRINMHVYSTGRKLLSVGVIPGSDMLPETAYVKLSWVLGQTRDLHEVRRLILTNIAGEINNRITVDLYPRWPV